MVEGLAGEKQSQMGFKSSPATFPGSKMQLMWLTLKFQPPCTYFQTLCRGLRENQTSGFADAAV